MAGVTVYGTFGINTPQLELFQAFVDDHEGRIFVDKPLKFEDLGLAELEDQKDSFQCLACSNVIKRKNHAVTHFRKVHSDGNQSEAKIPENIFGNFEISNEQVEWLEVYVETIGGEISVQRQFRFEDSGLVELEDQKDQFQCRTCSKVIKRKNHAVTHFKKFHMGSKRIEIKIQCPRCDAEMAKSDLNSHMEKAHGLQKFNQLIKRSFRPDMVSSTSEKVGKKIPKMKVEDDALSSGAKDTNNNDTAKKGRKQKQSKKEIKQDLGDKKVDDPLALAAEDTNNNDH